jgi:DNA-binding transcriptional regulator YdaS (Cro superfamily)
MNRLRTLLKNRGHSLTDLARALAVNKGTVSRWNKNEVPVERLEAIESKTGISKCDMRPDLASMFVTKQEVTS